MNVEKFIDFLKALLEVFRKIFLIGDGHPVHKAKKVGVNREKTVWTASISSCRPTRRDLNRTNGSG